MNDSCLHQHPTYMLTYLPKISIVKGLCLFHTFIRIFIYFQEISWSNLISLPNVDCLYHGCISHDLFLPFFNLGKILRMKIYLKVYKPWRILLILTMKNKMFSDIFVTILKFLMIFYIVSTKFW